MTTIKKATACLFFGLAAAVTIPADLTAETADYVFKNGKVYTLDAKKPWAESVAVKGNKIAYVGSDSGSKDWTGPETKVVDLKGQMLMPGFIDGHNHFICGPSGKRGLKLVGAKDKEEMLERIRAFVKANPQYPGYMGYGWEFPMFGGKRATVRELDAICNDKPMVFFNEDNHHAWFNTKAMNIAGWTKDTPDSQPGFSYLEREADNTPSGVAIEGEMVLQLGVKTGIFGGVDMIRDIANEVFPTIPQTGITACHDMGSWLPDFAHANVGYEVLMQLEKEGKLPFRFVGVYAFRGTKVSVEDGIKTMKEWNARYRSDLVRITGVKTWADGTFLGHTGLQLEPYADRPGWYGETEWTTDALAGWVEAAYAAGFDMHIHCEGDGSVRRSLDAVERVVKKLGPSERITTLHHIAVIHPDDLPRFKALGVGGNMTAVWLVDYKGQYQEAFKILGKEKVAKEFGMVNALTADGVNVTFGSDLPGTDPDEISPLFQIQAAVTGRVPGSATKFVPPANRLPSLDQMIQGYTLAGARQMRLADKIGSLEVGKLADLVVLDKNLFQIPPSEISATKVKLTMMNGNITYRAQ